MNDGKTEFLVIGAKHLLKKIGKEHTFRIGDETITASQSAKNIGATIDCNLDLRSHVNNIARSCYYHLRNIGHIRPHISNDTAATLVHAFISSKLDNLNSLLVGLPETVIRKLQLIQNQAAKIVTRKKKYDHVTPILKELHWLPIKMRIKFKVCLLTFKSLHGLAPKYVSDMLVRYVPRRYLRSIHENFLRRRIPNLKNTGGRSFAVSAPKMWNALPSKLRKCNDLEAFKSGLKTHLFREAFV